MSNWKTAGQQLTYRVFDPLIKLLLKIGVTPNMITTLGLLLNIFAAVIFIYGAEKADRLDHSYVGYGGFVILIGGLMDMFDGRMARLGNISSDFGALYDSVLDRYSEMFMFLGICYYLVAHNYFYSSLFAFIAMVGSVMVSYTRARSEGLGVSAKSGKFQRPERIILIGGSAWFCGIYEAIVEQEIKIDIDWLPFPLFETITIFTFPIFILAVFANTTAIGRLIEGKKLLDK